MEARPSTLTFRETTTPSLDSAVERFAPISLDEMNGVSLMRRVDTKYVIHRAQLPTVLAAVSTRYAILEIEGRRVMRYTSQYFDTAAFRFYRDHHDPGRHLRPGHHRGRQRRRCGGCCAQKRPSVETHRYFLP